MADPIATMDWAECLVPSTTPSAELVSALRREHGYTPSWLPRLAPLPWLATGFGDMTAMPFAYLAPRMSAVVALVVSRDNSCRFCYGAQRAFMRLIGYEVGAIERLERDEAIDTDPARQLALEFARRVSRGTVRPGAADRAALERAGFPSPSVAELAFAAASTVFANRVSTLVAFPPVPVEGTALQVVARFVRPLIRWRLAPRLRPPEPPPAPNEGLGKAVVAALGSSPAAGVLRRVIDDCLASPILPRRSKLFMIAVIARALGCRLGERDATAALVGEGVAAGDVADTLTHLASPSLDVREARLVPFARETVRCTPPEIQVRTRELGAALALDVPQLLEVIGVTSVANTLCRASVVVDPC